MDKKHIMTNIENQTRELIIHHQGIRGIFTPSEIDEI
jgi:hypothetical protein